MPSCRSGSLTRAFRRARHRSRRLPQIALTDAVCHRRQPGRPNRRARLVEPSAGVPCMVCVQFPIAAEHLRAARAGGGLGLVEVGGLADRARPPSRRRAARSSRQRRALARGCVRIPAESAAPPAAHHSRNTGPTTVRHSPRSHSARAPERVDTSAHDDIGQRRRRRHSRPWLGGGLSVPAEGARCRRGPDLTRARAPHRCSPGQAWEPRRTTTRSRRSSCHERGPAPR